MMTAARRRAELHPGRQNKKLNTEARGHNLTCSDFDMLRDLVKADSDWADIAEVLGHPVEILQRHALNRGWIKSRPVLAPAANGHLLGDVTENQDRARRAFASADDRYVAMCLQFGGFCRVELVDKRPVHVYPGR